MEHRPASDLPDPLRSTLEHVVARDLRLPEREAELDALCRAHPEHAAGLRRELELMLLAAAAAPTTPPPRADSDVPSSIGPYRILARLGQGGMGEVFKAEQREPVRRIVALKVIKQGLATKEVLARFALERRALAAMSHRCIAKVFDAGATDRGEPYFVMELVEGLPLTAHCDKHKLALPDRLCLFQLVCQGVQHAHQKGVVHRDLKPGNVLVVREGDEAIPKILDFGLAKATNRELVQETLLTELDRVMGTPEYMAPEQAAGDGELIDARADIYSLGVMLYELLTGELPFPTATLRKAGALEILRILREQDPPKPSTRLTTRSDSATAVAAQRRTSLGALSKALKGDLDWVVMRAMAKEPERRYDSASGLAMELERYLQHEPVLAGPPSASYRLRKLLRRYRGQAIAVAAVLVTAVTGAWFTSAFAFSAAENARIADQRAEEIGRQRDTIQESANALRQRTEEFDMVANVAHLRAAREREAALYPSWPRNRAGLERWLSVDAARLQDALPRLRATVETLRGRARPLSPADVETQRRGHADFAELERLERRRAELRRQRAVASGEQTFETPALPPELVDADARALREFAWPRIAFPEERTIQGEDDIGMAAALRALDRVENRGDTSLPRFAALDMVAWGWARIGRGEDALAASRRALELAPPEHRERLTAHLRVVGVSVEAAAGDRGLALLADLDGQIESLAARIDRSISRGFDDESEHFLFETLRDLIVDIEKFLATRVPEVQRRLAWASHVESLTTAHPNARVTWKAARDAIAANPHYAAHPLLDLQPQLGLVPIGENPVTGLWEFYHLASAWDGASDPGAIEIPALDADGRIPVGPGTGIVFALVPGGRFRMGASRDPADPDFDPMADGEEKPHEVALAPFFVARHELTQGQWLRLAGGALEPTPSEYGPGFQARGMDAPVDLTHPVESVDWTSCDTLLTQHGLDLPTEAQWEFGCRAGSRAPWSPGATIGDLRGVANMLDERAKRIAPTWVGDPVPWDDGFVLHAPVGSYAPNAFGLFDMHGNVWEWCRDQHGPYTLACRPDDGLRIVHGDASTQRVYRGGSFDEVAGNVRSSVRSYGDPTIRMVVLGVRAARAIRPR